jgi:3-hydroxyisobutyrate dehydrogenase-like beta-hydroxyacid dehydrogenase
MSKLSVALGALLVLGLTGAASCSARGPLLQDDFVIVLRKDHPSTILKLFVASDGLNWGASSECCRPSRAAGRAGHRRPRLGTETRLSMSTISTSAASHLAQEHARHRQGYVAAPVFGNPDAAKARELFIVAAGARTDIERCRPLFDGIGQKTFVIGTDPKHANLVKLLGNMMTATTLEVLGEVVAVALKRGLDPKSFIDIMTGTMFGGRAHKIYGDKIVMQSYAAGFVMPLVLKDVRLALVEAEYAGAPMPSVNVVRDRLIAGIARGYADLDWTAMALIAAQVAGFDVNPLVAVN